MKATKALADDQAEATLALELGAAEDVAGSLEKRLNSARREVTRAYVLAFGSLDAPAERGPALVRLIGDVESAIHQAMDGTGAAAQETLDVYTRKAAQLGAEQAAQVIPEASPLDAPERPSPVIAVVVDQAERDARRMLSQTLLVAAGATGVLAVVGRASRAVSDLRKATRTAVNETRNAVVHEVSDRYGYGRVWVAEEDGCVYCLAYAGQVAWEGESFPTGRTFGSKPLTWASELPDPPLHPHCRCEVIPYSESDGPAFPNALEREAKRSILKGWSLESESQIARLDAAQRLLDRGAGLPKSVEEASARALRRGKFPSRRVPKFTS